MFTVATQLADGTRRDGRNYPTLSRAERKAMERALTLPENAQALILGNTFAVEMVFPGQVPLAPAPEPKPKSQRRRK